MSSNPKCRSSLFKKKTWFDFSIEKQKSSIKSTDVETCKSNCEYFRGIWRSVQYLSYEIKWPNSFCISFLPSFHCDDLICFYFTGKTLKKFNFLQNSWKKYLTLNPSSIRVYKYTLGMCTYLHVIHDLSGVTAPL